MSTTLFLGDGVAFNLIVQTVALVLFYAALAWLPLRIVSALMQRAARRKQARRAIMLGRGHHDDQYHMGMKILPPM